MMEKIISLFFEIDIAAWGSLFAVLVAAVSFLHSRTTARKQAGLRTEDLLLKFDQNLMNWGAECIDEIAILQNFLWENDRKRVEMQLTAISALIDKGRLFLPNEGRKTDGSDAQKHPSYQGNRPKVLEILYQIYDFVRDLEEAGTNYTNIHARDVFNQRRIFVAELTSRLQTQRRRDTLEALAKRNS